MHLIQTMWVTWKHKMRSFVFDHEALGIRDEPFVHRFSIRLKEVLKSISDTALHNAVNNGFRLTLSNKPLPSCIEATLVKHSEGGAWYRFENSKEGWLGPVIGEMFSQEFPLVLYMSVDLK